MTATTTTFTVRGLKVRSASRRRFVVVTVRPTAVTTPNGTYVAFARIDKRSDSRETALTDARRRNFNGLGPAAFAVVVDTATGEEIS